MKFIIAQQPENGKGEWIHVISVVQINGNGTLLHAFSLTAEEIQEESQQGYLIEFGSIRYSTIISSRASTNERERAESAFPFAHEFPEKTSRNSLSRGPV